MAFTPDTSPILDGDGSPVDRVVHHDPDGNVVPEHTSDRTSQPTFRAAGSITVAAITSATTDLLLLQGSATKTVRLKKLRVGGVATAAEALLVLLKKHTFPNSGGTATTVAAAKHDSDAPNQTATLKVYSANPTITTVAIATMGAGHMVLTDTTGTSAAMKPVEWDFCRNEDQAGVLRSSTQEIAVNLNGVSPGAGAVLFYEVEWEEDDS